MGLAPISVFTMKLNVRGFRCRPSQCRSGNDIVVEPWVVFEVSFGKPPAEVTAYRLVVAYDRTSGHGRVSTPIVDYDPEKRWACTRSGSRYELRGPPALDADAWYTWQNHRGMNACLDLARRQAKARGVHLLDTDAVVFDDVRILGCTLWTDFCLRGNSVLSAVEASRNMNDFRGAIYLDGDFGPFRPEDSIDLHRRSVEWLDRELAKPFAGKTLVVTHHSPHPKCEHRFYATSPLSPAFCSDLGWLIERHQPALWISGHTHASHDIHIGATRLVSNQRGYRDTPEHADAPFNPSLTIEI
jgi:hypothetical protein